MTIEWPVIARLAGELQREIGGGRIVEAGRLADGRLALRVRTSAGMRVAAVDVFASPPTIVLETAEADLVPEPGFARALDAALRGLRIEAVAGVTGERLLFLDLARRSRFGVAERLRLILELIPRFGNAILTKSERIVAAAREFSPADNAVRSVRVGDVYCAPPARPRSEPDDAQERAVLAARAAGDAPVFLATRDGRPGRVTLLAADQVPPPGRILDGALEAMRLAWHEQSERAGADRAATRRARLERTLESRRAKIIAERAEVGAALARVAERDRLRERGETIYAHLYTAEAGARDALKAEAQRVFRAYRKLSSGAEPLRRRDAALAHELAGVEMLLWEAARAEAADLDDVAQAASRYAARPTSAARRGPRRRPLVTRASDGSRISIGRSPLENAELTFRHARPHDLWFHVRGAPGAHVILARDDAKPPDPDAIARAAALAAFYSRARDAGKVTVDFTQRKHVRKQLDAPPGLVWYTHARSIVVAPSAIEDELPS